MDKFLTAEQLAEKMQVNRQTIWRWEKQGLIKATRFGRTLRFNPEEITKKPKQK